MKQKNSRKALAVMVGTLIFLLVLAVVLLSVIIVSLSGDRPNPPESGNVTTAAGTTGRPESTTNGQLTTVPDPFGSVSTSVTGDKPQTTVTTAAKPTTSQVTPSQKVTATVKPTTSQIPTGNLYPPTFSETVTVKNLDGSVVKSGSFTGGSDAKLFLVIEWEAKYAYEGATGVQLTVRVYLKSFSVDVASRSNGVLSIGGVDSAFTSPAVKEDIDVIHMTLLCSRTVTLTKRSADPYDVDIDAAWNFRGVYSGVSIDWLTVSGNIEI